MLKTRFQTDGKPEIGVDEAGRGPLWGPLMAAAVLLPHESEWTDIHKTLMPQIQDSKKISPKKRERIAKEIERLALAVGVGIVMPEEIDKLGATRANQLAFRRAINEIKLEGERRILIDGILPLNDMVLGEECHTIIEGDSKYLSVAAASIVAKVRHDEWVVSWCSDHVAEAAKYDLLNCKGYGTARHREGILRHGYTDLHRRLYLRKLIPDIIVSRYEFVEDLEEGSE